jgi:PAS domain S-box-containing protein
VLTRLGKTPRELIDETLLGEAWSNADVAAALFDDGRNYVAVNNAFCELTGYPREQLLSMKVGRDLNGGDPESNSAFDAVVRGKRRAGTGRIHHADGRFVAINYAVTETEVADLPYFIAVVWPT